MSVEPGTIVIDSDSAFKKYCLDPTVKGTKKTRKFTGLIPRDFARQPVGSIASIPKTALTPIPRNEWSARIKEMKETKSRLSDIRMTARYGEMFPNVDQGNRGYCWAHSTVSAALYLRAKEHQPYVSLSAYAIACIIKNFRDEGGWNAQSVKFMIDRGCPSDTHWPQQGTKREYDNPATWADAANQKIVECGEDVDEGDFDMQMTYALLRIPGPLDLNHWGHSICQDDPEEIEPNHFGLWILNSWKNWGTFGRAVLTESKARNNGFIALRTGTISGVQSQENTVAQGV